MNSLHSSRDPKWISVKRNRVAWEKPRRSRVSFPPPKKNYRYLDNSPRLSWLIPSWISRAYMHLADLLEHPTRIL